MFLQMVNAQVTSLSLFYTFIFILCLQTGNIQAQECGSKGQVVNDLDSNVTKLCEDLRKLDKELIRMYKAPEDDKGDEMMRLSNLFNQASQRLLSLCTSFENKKKVLMAAKDMLDHGNPFFLDVDFEEEKLKEAFKWEQESMDKLSMIRLKIGEHWFDLWTLYKNLPDYDIENPE